MWDFNLKFKFINFFIIILFVFILISGFNNTSTYKKINIFDNNTIRAYWTSADSPLSLLKECSIKLNYSDYLDKPLNYKFKKNDSLTIIRRNIIYKNVIEYTKPKIFLIYVKSLPEGKNVQIKSGEAGKIKKTYKIILENNVLISKKLDKIKILKKSKPAYILVGTAKKQINRKRYTFLATAYTPHASDCAPFDDGLSAIGLPAGFGIAAVDPRIIPLGTQLYIPDYGFAYAVDVGSAIKGKRIDLCFENSADAVQFGKKKLDVYIIDNIKERAF